MKPVPYLIAAILIATALAGCTPVGAAAGAGAAVGVSAAQERGVSGAVSDFAIRTRISDLWFRYDVSTFGKLSLSVDQGRVLITGVVQDPDNRVQAVRLAWQVDGVREVINEIQLADSGGFSGYVTDEWIKARLRAALTFDRTIRSINYSIEASQGTVYLMGVAQDAEERARAVEIARTIPNVRSVVSYVRLLGEKLPATGAGG